jgi:hypothetical protein
MSSSTAAEPTIDVRAKRVTVNTREVKVQFVDGRSVTVPLGWYPRLLDATPAERNRFEVWDDGLYWPDLNADISFRAMLLGQKSGESKLSLKQWLDRRRRGEPEDVPTRPLPVHLAKALRRRSRT